MDYDNDLPATGLTTERAAAIVVIAALVLLWLINRGFRGVSVGGVSASIG